MVVVVMLEWQCQSMTMMVTMVMVPDCVQLKDQISSAAVSFVQVLIPTLLLLSDWIHGGF